MDPVIWIPIGVGVIGLVLSFHWARRRDRRQMQEDLDKRIDEKVEMCVQDVVTQLKAIEVKLNNGVLQASQEHTEEIVKLKVQAATVETKLDALNITMTNLSRQIESVLIGRKGKA